MGKEGIEANSNSMGSNRLLSENNISQSCMQWPRVKSRGLALDLYQVLGLQNRERSPCDTAPNGTQRLVWETKGGNWEREKKRGGREYTGI